MKLRRSVLVFALVAGCGDDDTSDQTVVDAAAPAKDSALLDANSALAPPACDFQAALTARLDGKVPDVDCGRLSASPASVDAEKAVQCVLDAIAAGKSFALIQGDSSLLTTERNVFVGTPKLASIFKYGEYVQLPRARTEVSSQSCKTLVRTPGCTPSGTDICLGCDGELERGVQCTGTNDFVECNEAGNYDRNMGKAGTLPCCVGLSQVEQRAQLKSDDSTSTCSFTPMRLFACIQGFCGDGRCEPEEAIACGCELDCPIAKD